MLAGGQEEGDFDVIVIGAGIAGLAAAKKLYRMGYDVGVLEGRNRIGGRIWTDHSWNGLALDLGASWIHGIDKNPIMSLARELNVKTILTDYDSIIVYDSQGNEITGQRLDKIWDNFGKFEKFLKAKQKQLPKNSSIQLAVDKFVSSCGEENIKTRQEMEEFLYTVNTYIEQDYAAFVSDMSLPWFDLGGKFPGEDVFVPNGYEQIINMLADGLDIRLQHVITKIKYNKDCGVQIITGDQRTYTADYVVVTVPLGVLKKGSIEFSPPLPHSKTSAIKNLKMGILDKSCLLFSKPFWDKDVEMIGYVSEERGKWSEFLNLYKYTGQPVLLGFNAGVYGNKLERLPDEKIVEEQMQVLRKIYGDDIEEPIDTIITRWGKDEFAYGSYSFTPVGATPSDYLSLAEPIENRVFFAGEATSDQYSATVHGAYLSGIREADRICQIDPIKQVLRFR